MSSDRRRDLRPGGLTRRALLLSFVPSAAAAQEFIAVDGPLSDAAFYRLVACAAPPGGECRKPFLRWPEERALHLRAGIAGIDPGFPGYKRDLVDQALDAAIAEVNAVGARLYLSRGYDGRLDIPLYLLDQPFGTVIETGTHPDLDGEELGLGQVVLRARGETIARVAIAISSDISRREIASVVLEEVVQALGLPTDISSPAYSRSIFAEESNSVVWLRGQDAEALRRHYPRS